MIDKSQLGTRFTCFTCGTKFYDLNRPVPACPECGADQREAPARDIKAMLRGKGVTYGTSSVPSDFDSNVDDDDDDDDLGLDDDDDGDDGDED